MRFYILLTTALLVLFSCGSNDLYNQKLNGFDKGKRTFKMQVRLNTKQLQNNQLGFEYDTSFRWAVGNKANRSTVRSSTLNADYSLVQTKMTRIRDDEKVNVTTNISGDKINITITGGEEPKGHTLTHKGPVFLAFPVPMLIDLSKEMQPGDERKFDVLLDEAGEVKTIGLRYVGEEKIFRGGDEIMSYHFQQQAPTAMDEWDDYFIDMSTNMITKINMGQIEFLPEP